MLASVCLSDTFLHVNVYSIINIKFSMLKYTAVYRIPRKLFCDICVHCATTVQFFIAIIIEDHHPIAIKMFASYLKFVVLFENSNTTARCLVNNRTLIATCNARFSPVNIDIHDCRYVEYLSESLTGYNYNLKPHWLTRIVKDGLGLGTFDYWVVVASEWYTK